MPNEDQNLLEIAPPPEYVETRFRPSKLTPELIEDFKRIMPNCFFLKTAASILGIDYSTMAKWVRRGRLESIRMAESGSNLCRRSEYLYLEFFLAHREILALTESEAIAEIRAAGASGVWQASVWQLERRYPDRYGSNRQEIKTLAKISIEQTGKIDVLQNEINALLRSLRASVGDVKPANGK